MDEENDNEMAFGPSQDDAPSLLEQELA